MTTLSPELSCFIAQNDIFHHIETMGIDDIKKFLNIIDDSSPISSDDCNTFNKIRYNNQEYKN